MDLLRADKLFAAARDSLCNKDPDPRMNQFYGDNLDFEAQRPLDLEARFHILTRTKFDQRDK